MDGSLPVGAEPDHQSEVQDAGPAETGWGGCRHFQEARLEVLPAEDRSLPYRAIPGLGEEAPHPSVLVVRERNTDARPPLQGVRRVEGTAEDALGRGQKGNWEMEEPLEGPGPAGGREIQQGGTGLPLYHGRGEASTSPGWGGRAERGVEWELRERREREEERRVEAEELGVEVEEPLFLPTPAFMASAEEE
jgi:hypothetical protein